MLWSCDVCRTCTYIWILPFCVVCAHRMFCHWSYLYTCNLWSNISPDKATNIEKKRGESEGSPGHIGPNHYRQASHSRSHSRQLSTSNNSLIGDIAPSLLVPPMHGAASPLRHHASSVQSESTPFFTLTAPTETQGGFYIVLITLLSSLSGFLFGYDTGKAATTSSRMYMGSILTIRHLTSLFRCDFRSPLSYSKRITFKWMATRMYREYRYSGCSRWLVIWRTS